MSIISSAEEFEKYRLVAESHKDCTHQYIRDSFGGSSSRQIWKRARSLGQGAFGDVWQETWEDAHGDRSYRAVKICSTQKMQAASIDYRRELSALAAFSHSEYSGLFVNLHGWWTDSEHLFVVMEYLRHSDLSKYLTLKFQEMEIQEIADNVLRGLKVMHREGFTHRDIKPQNILVVQKRPEYPRWWVKIADFGISKRTLTVSGTALHTMIGTRPYCAPEVLGHLEQYQEISVYSSKVDIWSLGCVLFNISSQGRFAFSEPDLVRYCDGMLSFNPHKVSLSLSNSGESFVRALLSAEPERRPSADEALEHHWLAMKGTSAASPFLTSATNLQLRVPQTNKPSLDATLSPGSLNVGVAKETTRTVLDVSKTPKQHETQLDATTKNSLNPSHAAADKGPLGVPKQAEEQGASTHQQVNLNWYSVFNTPKGEQLQLAKRRVEQGLSIHKKEAYDWTPFHHAIYLGNFELAKWLEAQGANIHEKDDQGRTPIYLALEYGHPEIARWLIGKGVGVHDTANNGRTLVDICYFPDIREWLQQRGVNWTI